MNSGRRYFAYVFLLLALPALVGWGPFSFLSHVFSNTPKAPEGSEPWISAEVARIHAQADNLDPQVLRLGLIAYLKARKLGMDAKQMLTIVDYSKPSTKRRMWVIDLKRARVLFNTWVTHGKNSGGLNATSFSNRPGSLKSSIGVFDTAQPYFGHEGYSLRVKGLEAGINDKAYQRDVVVHGAWYATERVAKTYPQLGRSWGCFAVGENTAKPLIDTIKNDTLIVAYYPDQHWLDNSTWV